jgi:CheY-like chemotaxis protein
MSQEPSQNQPDAHAKSSKTILIVEDSPVQALALLKLLEQNGLGVLCAPNGQAGLSMARQYVPDLIILDIRMPGMDGLEACRRLKQDPRTTDIPIVLFTAHSEPEFLREGLERGAVDFIPKDDFSEVVLLETLKQLNIIS